ncbi:hypothetical protein FQA39_LY12075 [Lamprigera yunnana]|nr:hypothetical protein FQA39_LY12075 [Lamprigera yunnana]
MSNRDKDGEECKEKRNECNSAFRNHKRKRIEDELQETEEEKQQEYKKNKGTLRTITSIYRQPSVNDQKKRNINKSDERTNNCENKNGMVKTRNQEYQEIEQFKYLDVMHSDNCTPIPHVPLEKPIDTVAVAAYQENLDGTTYFYPSSAENSVNTNDSLTSISGNISSASNYQVYPDTPNHITALKFRTGSSSFFIGEDTCMDILNRNALSLIQPDFEQCPDLPQDVDNYHELCPLEPIPTNPL